MKTQLLLGVALMMATSLLAADPKDEVKSAAKKLADAGGYSWKTTTDMGGGGGGRQFGPTTGKFANGMVQLTRTRGDNTTEAYLKDGKGAIQTQEGWQSLAELLDDSSGQNRGRFMARTYQNFKAPAVEVAELAGKVKELKKEGETYTGELTAEGVKSFFTFGRGGNAPEVANPKGTVKIWTKDGVISKYEYHLQGTMTFNNNDRDFDRATTVEINNVGSTRIEVPAAAKAKLQS